ncbi:sigma-70 family RNA polymerase sigma factor [Noviherbaspirillum pedocola]|uniref:RNA polymerase sigma factor n=1 Tax=Noviherbaspirillum pedocola TaxID=2801341 RepID=A0A934SYD4_9BURK|nr:sigma-70 family RNA polymerase sigma factor [Noviherbaspirillum pedocola]MBK4734003.1 sigma-70 family RNA polymerase sigma factor [Noviherbaspirillum pedocola]
MKKLVAIEGDRWVERAQKGDQQAFSLLVDAYHTRVWRFLLKWVRNRDDAEELVQETFLAAWRALPSFRAGSQFSTWLLGIALNLARNHHNRTVKKLSRNVELDETIYMDTPSGSDIEPDRQLERLQTMEALQQAIDNLPEDMRQVLIMVRLEGMQLEEVAEILGIPSGTVKSRLSRAKGRLLEQMGHYL